MCGRRADRVVHRIERGLVIIGVTCLVWVGATSLSALVYQVEKSASLERRDRRHGTFRYRVMRHTVVEPDELWVLDASSAAALTLITCHPFDYLGPAPRRFIVHAERTGNASDSSHTTSTAEATR